ncbi:MAG: hypothetical protein LBC02_04515, partial [Planctomycetaceae bacterium]|nr:hypothetical protein [Planctomycetaceae bacterium]
MSTQLPSQNQSSHNYPQKNKNEIENEIENKHDQEQEAQPTKRLIPVAVAIVLILCLYAYLLSQGIPQQWTEIANNTHHTSEQHSTEEQLHATEHEIHENSQSPEKIENPEKVENSEQPHHPPYFMIAPFAILLLSIAFLPLHPVAARFWESNTNKFLVAFGLGLITLLYYFFACNFPVELHWPGHEIIKPSPGSFQFEIAKTVFINAILNEFIPFIVLLFSL